VDKCITKGWWWYSETSEIACTVQQTSSETHLIARCSPAVKTLYSLPVACQCMLANCGANTQTGINHLRVAYNDAYRIMHYIPRNISVHPYQVNHCVRTLDALYRNNLYHFLQHCAFSSNFLSDRFNCLMLLGNLHISSIIKRSCMTVTNWAVVGAFFLCMHLISSLLPLRSLQNFFVAPQDFCILLWFLCHLQHADYQTRKKWIYITSKTPTVKSCFKFSENNWLSAVA